MQEVALTTFKADTLTDESTATPDALVTHDGDGQLPVWSWPCIGAQKGLLCIFAALVLESVGAFAPLFASNVFAFTPLSYSSFLGFVSVLYISTAVTAVLCGIEVLLSTIRCKATRVYTCCHCAGAAVAIVAAVFAGFFAILFVGFLPSGGFDG